MKEAEACGTRSAFASLALITLLLVAGCGGSSDNDNGSSGDDGNGSGGGSTGMEITGQAQAPGGFVARLAPQSIGRLALNFLVAPAAAEIFGLQPVSGTRVELVRVDATGVQVGSVLAETTTSATGSYTLTLPAGIELSADLVVRITGMGGTEMRAQVVEQAVDITPVSEFVLQRFIDSGSDLTTIETAAVVKLVGQVEEFDLTATADMTTMLASLQAQTAAFVEAQIDLMNTAPGDAASVAGEYRLTSLGWQLHGTDAGAGGTMVNSIEHSNLALSDAGAGQLDVSVSSSESADAMLDFWSGTTSLRYPIEISSEAEAFSAALADNGVLSVESPFEEEIDGDFAWRFPPQLTRLQKVSGANVFLGLSESAAVRYQTVDTNDDGVKDAVDPEARDGDEVFRDLFFLVKKPTAAGLASVSGDYGRVWLASFMTAGGYVELQAEANKLSFDGVGHVDAQPGTTLTISRLGNGTTSFASDAFPTESGIPISIQADGDIDSVGGESADGFVSDDFGLLVLNDASANDDANPDDMQYADASMSTTLAVKLPQSLLDLQGNEYRIVLLSVELEGAGFSMYDARFDSVLSIVDATTGTANGQGSSVSLDAVLGGLTVESEEVADEAAAVTLAADGAMTVSFTENDGETVWQGYINADGTLGVFTNRYTPAGGSTTELGLALLLKI